MCPLSFIFTGCKLISKEYCYKLRKIASNICGQLETFIDIEQEFSESEQTTSKRNRGNDLCNTEQIPEGLFEDRQISNDEKLISLVKSGKNLVQELPEVHLLKMEKEPNLFSGNSIFTIYYTKSIIIFVGSKYRKQRLNN